MANQDGTVESFEGVEVRECTSMEEFDACIELQREVFGLPDLEISPRRHLIVSRRAGGWTLGAFYGERLAGFVHQMAAMRNKSEAIGYSHMMAVRAEYQNLGLGALLKWKQRRKSLDEGKTFITWTWDPMQARNAHFNLNRLGVTVSAYAANFYGTGYSTMPGAPPGSGDGLDSDRLFADWQLDSSRVNLLAEGRQPEPAHAPVLTIEIPTDWAALVRENAVAARREQLRVRAQFQEAFNAGLVCAGFQRDDTSPRYLLYSSDE